MKLKIETNKVVMNGIKKRYISRIDQIFRKNDESSIMYDRVVQLVIVTGAKNLTVGELMTEEDFQQAIKQYELNEKEKEQKRQNELKYQWFGDETVIIGSDA